ncbi:unnamed protein product [Lasius platythorax]|uniref:Uncharacterized protein n=1 Tax=Lasius platythorax TaxID=488582 RepID=A0AAV2PAX7_9HYME
MSLADSVPDSSVELGNSHRTSKPGRARVSLAELSAAIRPTRRRPRLNSRASDMGCGGSSDEPREEIICEIVT